MSCERETVDLVRQAGRRVTIQRQRVAVALRHAGGHRTAEELHEIVSRDDPHGALSLSTVYRVLATLQQLRLVGSADIGGRESFEWTHGERHHHHLICGRCGDEQTLPSSLVDSFGEHVRAETDFEVHLDHLTLAGLCEPCRVAATTTAPTHRP